MRTIGFIGGGTICELGSPSDMQLFFDCIKSFPEFDNKDMDWSVITDRLYKRYLKLDELELAENKMRIVQDSFRKILSSTIEWDTSMIGNPEKTKLNPHRNSLAEVFNQYFESFFHCVEAATLSYVTFTDYPGYEYQPVKIVPTDTSLLMIEV